ncbi:MAG: hypothetical protein ASARMPREDX12_005980 [Alectoria sarmentosa]|nr:MAG: hypothetical protein ASARMPREDX12_005980 [Alectoria sarmentosa]
MEKPSRSIEPHRTIKRTHYVSFGFWPKDTSWGSQQSTTDSLEEIHRDWTANFQTLKIPENMQTWTSQATNRVIRYYCGPRSGRNHVNEEWMGLQGYDADRLWRNVMLWCLKYRQNQALTLLLATLKGRKYTPPRYVVSDCLDFLARHLLFKVSNPNPLAINAIWLLTCRFIDGAGDQDRTCSVPQHLVCLVLQHSDDLRVLSFYGLLGLNKAVLHVNTMLHFLDRFLDMGRINLCIKLLGTIANTNFNLSADQIQMACVKLLRARFDTQEEYTVRSNILTQILEMGIRPSVHMFNAILLNAGEGGDFANAWQMYGLAKENALLPDSITYGVLLKGAKLSGDSSNLKTVIGEIQTNGKVLQDIRLVSDVLNAISLMSPGDEFGAMLDFYRQHCDLRPLQELSLCGDETQAPPGANCRGVWPTSYILTQMILAYARLHQDSLGLIHSYSLYYQHVKENHPLIAPLAQGDFVANSFIMAFGKRPDTLQYCTTVVKHMLEFSSLDFATFDNIPYAAPTVQTWSILVAAYFRNRQSRAAEKVLDVMRERGIQGDRVTWNTLVSGYAGMQDVSAAVDTVKRMEAAGFEMDTYTTKGLEKLRLRDRLEKALTTSVEEQSVKKGISNKGLVPPLNSEEQYEANMGLEWGSTSLNREEEVEKYLRAKDQDQLDTGMEKPSDSLFATA